MAYSDFITNLKINQNVLVLAIFLISLGFSEVYSLNYLFWISLFGSYIIGIFVIISMVAYTYNYSKGKLK
ncbi:MAG: hypothetical protein PHD81_04660 [Candidatus Nanoarchaeia archaeon]|nr:hypothetical protein [Candidatus Nanoarchaeia archaeon]MDD5588368.1 hypothetical protein [Candidatus Nanoarchaeia archaeon]